MPNGSLKPVAWFAVGQHRATFKNQAFLGTIPFDELTKSDNVPMRWRPAKLQD